MRTTTEPIHTHARGRALTTLGVADSASAAEARAELLRRLSVEEFAPPEECVVAANALAGTTLPLSEDATASETERDLTAIEAFTREYWSLSPADRRMRWTNFDSPGVSEPVAARLKQLEPGLDLPVVPHPNPLAEEVAAAIRELFLLSGRARAIRRAIWLTERAGWTKDLGGATRRLQWDAPRLTRLTPDFVGKLIEGPLVSVVPAISDHARQEAEAKTRLGPRDVPVEPPIPQLTAGWPSTSGLSEPVSAVNLGRAAVAMIVLLVGVVKALFSGSRTDPPLQYQTPPRYTSPVERNTHQGGLPPQIELPESQSTVWTRLEVLRFELYADQPNGSPPKGYFDWLAEGSPPAGTKKQETVAPPEPRGSR